MVFFSLNGEKNMKRQKIIAAVIIAFAMLVLCGCGDLVVEKNASKGSFWSKIFGKKEKEVNK